MPNFIEPAEVEEFRHAVRVLYGLNGRTRRVPLSLCLFARLMDTMRNAAHR